MLRLCGLEMSIVYQWMNLYVVYNNIDNAYIRIMVLFCLLVSILSVDHFEHQG
jgi:hypothetical protein